MKLPSVNANVPSGINAIITGWGKTVRFFSSWGIYHSDECVHVSHVELVLDVDASRDWLPTICANSGGLPIGRHSPVVTTNIPPGWSNVCRISIDKLWVVRKGLLLSSVPASNFDRIFILFGKSQNKSQRKLKLFDKKRDKKVAAV